MKLAALIMIVFAFSQPVSAEDEECVIPPAPPCLPFSDPRWSDPGCRVSEGACWYILTESVKEQIQEATLTIVPICEDPDSHEALKTAAFKVLSSLSSKDIGVTILTKPCSSAGYADIKIGNP